ncbi:alpha-amylase, partial [Vibrio sp. 10N.222.55.C6]
LRSDHQELTIVAANFSQHTTENIHLKIPSDVIQKLKLVDGRYILNEYIEGIAQQVLDIENSVGSFNIELKPLASLAWVLSLNG